MGQIKEIAKQKLRLDISDHSKAGVIVPGKVSESVMIERILSNDPDEVMPPKNHRKKLSQEEKIFSLNGYRRVQMGKSLGMD